MRRRRACSTPAPRSTVAVRAEPDVRRASSASARDSPGSSAAAKRPRVALWQLAQQRVAGLQFTAAPLEIVNNAAAVPALVPCLHLDGKATIIHPPASAALSTLARDSIDLFSGSLKHRLRTCSACDCDLLFVDSSRPGTRRWCSMQRCGATTKMRNFRARHQDESPLPG